MISSHPLSRQTRRGFWLLGGVVISVALVLSGCGAPPPTQEVTTEPTEAPPSPPPSDIVEVPVYVDLLDNPSPSGFPEDQLDVALDLAEETLHSILLIALDESVDRGTGWLVSPQHVVTNWHVVEFVADSDVVLYDSEGNKHLGRVVAMGGPGRDLAVIELDAPVTAPPLRILERPVDPGTPVVSTGHGARIGAWSSKAGIVVEYTRFNALLHSVPTAPGDSGSPIMTLNGDVIGVVSGLNFDDGDLPLEEPTIHTFMPARDNGTGPTAALLKEFLDTYKIPYELSE